MPNPISDSKLVRLIISLKQNEKRYVVLHLSKHKKNTNLLKLYKQLITYNSKNDRSVYENGSSKKSTSQLIKNTYKLYQLVLDALHQFHSKKSPYARILTMLHQAEILAERGLAKDQQKILIKSGRIADTYELPELKLEILKMRNSTTADQQTTHRIQKEIKNLSDTIVRHAQLAQLNKRVIAFRRNTGVRLTTKQTTHLKEMGLDELTNQKFNLDSFFMKYSYLDYLSIYYTITGKYYESYLNGLKILKLVKKNKHLLRLQIWRDKYSATLNRLLNASAMISEDETVELAYNEISSLDIPENRKTLIELNFLDVFIQSGEFEKGEKSLIAIEKKAMHVENKFDPYIIAILYFNLAVMNFGLGHYSKAISWFSKNLNEGNKYIPDINFGRIVILIRLITYYELKQYDTIENYIRSSYHYINKQKSDFKFDRIMLKCIEKMISITNSVELLKVMVATRSELLKLSRTKTEAGTLYYFDFISWLDSKIENSSFAEVVRNKSKLAIRKSQ